MPKYAKASRAAKELYSGTGVLVAENLKMYMVKSIGAILILIIMHMDELLDSPGIMAMVPGLGEEPMGSI